jgi:hypothetical protein
VINDGRKERSQKERRRGKGRRILLLKLQLISSTDASMTIEDGHQTLRTKHMPGI